MAEATINRTRFCTLMLICLLSAEPAITASSRSRPPRIVRETDTDLVEGGPASWHDSDDDGSVSPIKVEPGTTVRVGEEVFFDGSGVTIEGAKLLPNGMIDGSYEWNFGDGYTLMKGSNYYLSDFGGTSTSHFYMRPGTYTALLKVSDVNGRTKITAIPITVEGREPRLPPRPAIKPILELKFEDNLDDTSGNGFIARWNGPGSFVRGVEGQAVSLTNGSYIEVLDPSGTLTGAEELTISLWAKKRDATVQGCLLDKSGAYRIALNRDEKGLSNVVKAHLTTESSSARASKWPADEIVNTMWHHYVVVYTGSMVRLFVDGIENITERHAPVPLTGLIRVSTDGLLIGKKSDAPDVFDGLMDEIKIYDKALTAREVTVGFELWHADFHGRIAQYIYAQIPGAITEDPANKIKVTVNADNGYAKSIYYKDHLQPEECFLLRNAELPAGHYSLVVQLLDATDGILDELSEKFEKPYDGVPEVGIDENNAIRINGELFFPVVPWGLNNPESWAYRYINALNGQAWWSGELNTGQANLTTWQHYLTQANTFDLKVAGPARWQEEAGYYSIRNADPKSLEQYVQATRDNKAMLMWMWGDEPYEHRVPASVLRSRTYKSHKLDPHHLVDTNYMGHLWDEGTWCEGDWGWKTLRRMQYTYFYNANYFGGRRTPVTDVIGFDYYPLHTADRKGDNTTVQKLAAIWDRIRLENYDLVPIHAFVEASDVDWKGPVPTPQQLRALTWLNVVKGAKGIRWLPYKKPPLPENFAVMAEFLDHITMLTPVVLGPETERRVIDNADVPGRRVDTMVREYEDSIWIFAVRLTEVDEVNDPPVQVTFMIDGLTSDMTVFESGMFSQSVWEHHGSKEITVARQTFSFTVSNAPITPGTLQIAGQYKEDGNYRIYLYDDGKGCLYGIPGIYPLPTKDMFGRVDYATGRVYVNFGQVKLDWVRWVPASILPGVDMVTAAYRPATEDRIIPHTGNRFTDTFAPNAVRIYRIPLIGQAGQLPQPKRPLYLPHLRLY